jgi:hypothetical protein
MTASKRLLALALALSTPLVASALAEARPAEPAPTTLVAAKPPEAVPAPPAAKPAVSWA